jgi:C1A family cysteine protease
LKRALLKGPVTVMVNAEIPFKYYHEGVIESQECDPDVNHAVLAVGWGRTIIYKKKGIPQVVEYFILKNSWGKYWGENGYVKVSSSRRGLFLNKGTCGIYVESY